MISKSSLSSSGVYTNLNTNSSNSPKTNIRLLNTSTDSISSNSSDEMHINGLALHPTTPIMEEEFQKLKQIIDSPSLRKLELTGKLENYQGSLKKIITCVTNNTQLQYLHLGILESLGKQEATQLQKYILSSSSLVALELSGFFLDTKLAEFLYMISKITNLKTFKSTWNLIGPKSIEQLKSLFSSNQSLAHLEVTYHGMSQNNLNEFLGILRSLPRLEILSLKYDTARYVYEIKEGITSVLTNASLQDLNLKGNNLTEDMMQNLSMLLRGETNLYKSDSNFALSKLNLSAIKTTPKGMEVFLQSLGKNTTVTDLNMCFNPFSKQSLSLFSEALSTNFTLRKLGYSFLPSKNSLNASAEQAQSLKHITDGLSENTTLEELILSGSDFNSIKSEDLKALIVNCNLNSLSLAKVKNLTEEHITALSEGLWTNQTLCKIDFGDLDIGGELFKKIQDRLAVNAKTTGNHSNLFESF